MRRDLFSKYAGTYDYHAVIQKKTAEWIMASLSPGLKTPSSVLDYGCGTGIMTSLMHSRYPDARLYACDVSEAMLEVARKKDLNKVAFFKVSPDAPNFLGTPYSLIVSNAVLHWIRENYFFEFLFKALHPDGKLIFTAYAPDSFPELNRVLEHYFKRKISLPVSSFKNQSSWETILSSSFKNWKVEKRSYSLEFNNLKEMFRSVKYTGTTGGGLGFFHFWTQKDLKSVENIFISMYKKIVNTYEIFLCTAF